MKPRQAVLIDPNAVEPDRKTRNLEKERRKRERDHFRATHPLCKFYESLQFVIWCREDLRWRQIALYEDYMCSAWANMSPATQEKLADVLPNPPDPLHVNSTLAWVAYLSFLLSAKSRRDALLERVVGIITEEFGEDFLPVLDESWIALDDAFTPPF